MKKYLYVIISVLLIVCMCFSLAGCSSANDDDKTKMSRIVNSDLADEKDDFDSSLRHYKSDYSYEHKGRSEYHLTGTAYFKNGSEEYEVEVFYIFLKQSDGSFYAYSKDIGGFVRQ